MRNGEAVMKLVSMGYHFELVGEKVRYEWQGTGDPDAGQVAPILSLLCQRKEDVRFFLKCHCPKCGGAVFGIFSGLSRCMGCDWGLLVDASKRGNNGKINEDEGPQVPPGEKILRCGPRQLSLIKAQPTIKER